MLFNNTVTSSLNDLIYLFCDDDVVLAASAQNHCFFSVSLLLRCFKVKPISDCLVGNAYVSLWVLRLTLSVCLQYHFSFIIIILQVETRGVESDSCRRKTTPHFFSHELFLRLVELTVRKPLVIAAAVWRFSITCVCETDRNIIY